MGKVHLPPQKNGRIERGPGSPRTKEEDEREALFVFRPGGRYRCMESVDFFDQSVTGGGSPEI